MELTKEAAREIRRGDFIPDGGSADLNTLRFRKTREDEVYYCCRKVEYDPQSGPIFCGDISEHVAFTADGYVGCCERHPPPKNLID